MKSTFNNHNLQKFGLLLIYLFPLSLVIGPLVSELIILLVLIIYFRDIKKNINTFKANKFFLGLFLFYFSINFSSIFGHDLIHSIKTSVPYIRHIIFCFLVFILINENKINLNKYLIFLFLLLFILVIDLLVQFNFGKNIIGFEKVGHFRYGGMFEDELVLGSFLLRISPVFLALLYIKNFKHKNICSAFFLFILIFSTLLTGERTAFYLSILFSFLCFLVLQISFKIKFTIIVSILLILVFFLNINNNVKDRMFNSPVQSIFKNNKIVLFTKNHEKLYIASIKMFKSRPFLGSGPKSFRIICNQKEFFVDNKRACSTHPHNIYFQLLAETGILGAFCLLTFIFFLMFMFIKNISIKNNHYKIPLYFLIFGNLINFFPLSPSGNFFNNWYSMLLFFNIPFLIFCRNQIKKVK